MVQIGCIRTHAGSGARLEGRERHDGADRDLVTSRRDRFGPPRRLEDFARAADGARVCVRTLVLPTGGHDFDTWQRTYPEVIPGSARG